MQNIGEELQRSALRRAWIQRGGPRPSNALRYAGADGSYIEIGDSTEPIRSITREQVHSLEALGAYQTVAVIQGPAEFSTNAVMFKNKRGALPWIAWDEQCFYNLYQPTGYCKTPGDFSGGWETGVTIFARGLGTQKARQGLAKFSEDVASVVQVDTTWTGGIYDVGPLYFEEEATAEVVRQIVDVTYFLSQSCGQCGPANDGTKWRYALQQDDGASTGILGTVIYTTDDGVTYAESPVSTLGGNETVTGIDGFNGALIVLSDTGNSYHWAPVDAVTGDPGTWAEVTSGFVASKLPRDLYPASPTELYIVGDGGYVYTVERAGGPATPVHAGTVTTNNLARVDGSGDVIVAVGASGTVLVSRNRGRSWAVAEAAIDGTPSLTAILCVDAYLWYVGTGGGQIYYTQTGGKEWTELTFSGSGAGVVYDIVGATPEVLYFSHSTATPDARVFASMTGGAIWDLSTSAGQQRIQDWPTFDTANRLAVPKLGTLELRANSLFVGGLAGNGTDGILLHGTTNVEFS